MNEKENTTYQNLSEAVLRLGKFIAVCVYIKKEERTQISNLNFHVKKLEKEEQIKSKASRRKKIIKIRAEINELEKRKAIQKINKTKS